MMDPIKHAVGTSDPSIRAVLFAMGTFASYCFHCVRSALQGLRHTGAASTRSDGTPTDAAGGSSLPEYVTDGPVKRYDGNRQVHGAEAALSATAPAERSSPDAKDIGKQLLASGVRDGVTETPNLVVKRVVSKGGALR